MDSAAGVGYWTDYLKTFLHPRSLYQLPGVWQGAGRFRAFGEGKGHATSEALEDIMDRIRYWAEECNSFQVSWVSKCFDCNQGHLEGSEWPVCADSCLL